jgi:thiamine-monophosphate kinase
MRSEFEFIQHIKEKYSLNHIGDDCAVLPKDDKSDMVVTADMLVEDIDFRLEWMPPAFLGHKALTVSLSDVAAMGAKPIWAMLSIGVPEKLWNEDFLDRFYLGWHRNARKSRVELAGGDISRTPDKLVIDSIVAGEVPKGRAILRSGAKVGDAIVVTDHVGGSAGGLRLLQNGVRLEPVSESWEDVLLTIHLQPWPQTGTGIYLQERGFVTSMIDISDGLASDLQHICDASQVGAKLDARAIPLNLNLRKLADSFEEQLGLALNGGEDFQLLFTVPKSRIPELSAGLIGGRDYGLFTVIGETTSDPGKIELELNDELVALQPRGYRHF